jgi:hypothetical protein
MCVRAGWNMVTKGKLFVDLVDGEIVRAPRQVPAQGQGREEGHSGREHSERTCASNASITSRI